MEQKKLDEILENHRKWLNNEEGGEGANLQGADLDFSCWPLWCGSLKTHINDRIGIQLLYHAVSPILYSKYTSKWLKKGVSCVVWICNKFHKVGECGKLEEYKEE